MHHLLINFLSIISWSWTKSGSTTYWHKWRSSEPCLALPVPFCLKALHHHQKLNLCLLVLAFPCLLDSKCCFYNLMNRLEHLFYQGLSSTVVEIDLRFQIYYLILLISAISLPPYFFKALELLRSLFFEPGTEPLTSKYPFLRSASTTSKFLNGFSFNYPCGRAFFYL